jgi:hypothetical protein
MTLRMRTERQTAQKWTVVLGVWIMRIVRTLISLDGNGRKDHLALVPAALLLLPKAYLHVTGIETNTDIPRMKGTEISFAQKGGKVLVCFLPPFSPLSMIFFQLAILGMGQNLE